MASISQFSRLLKYVVWIAAVFPVSIFLSACRQRHPPLTTTLSWADSTLSHMTLEAKIAQMIMVEAPVPGDVTSRETREAFNRSILNGSVGGIVLFSGHPLTYATWMEWAQNQSDIPLFVALDAEWGAGYRFQEMTRFPDAMALAATGNTQNARLGATITSRQAAAVGVNVIFAPVADVLTNSMNPVIGTRAWSDHPDTVSIYALAFAGAVRAEGLLPVAKHFPGHGSTSRDSHTSVPTADRTEAEFFDIDLKPFKALFADSIGAIMTAHILSSGHSYSDSVPVTLSRKIVNDLARDSLHFQGLIFSDALNMTAVTSYGSPSEVSVGAILAGVDVLLMPPDASASIVAIIKEIRSGRISVSRIDSSVSRILKAKQRLGLHLKTRFTDVDQILNIISSEDADRTAQFIGREAVTVLKDDSILPLSGSTERLLLITTDFRSYGSDRESPSSLLETAIRKRNQDNVSHISVNPRNWTMSMPDILRQAGRHRAVLFADFIGITPVFGWNRMRFLNDLMHSGATLIVLEHSSPFVVDLTPEEVAVHIVAYDSSPAMIEATADVLFGMAPASGSLPVNASQSYPRGYGLRLPQYVASEDNPSRSGMSGATLSDLDFVLNQAIADSAFPAAALAIGRGQHIVKRKDYGFHTYDRERILDANDIFDLASLTKVIATTTAIMQLEEQGLIDLHRPVADYLPEFGQNGKGSVTIWQLLTHTGGLIPFRQFYDEGVTTASMVRERIMEDSLFYEPGSLSKYSDFGPIILAWLVEELTAESFGEYTKKEIFEPLSMYSTGFKNIRRGAIENAVPTELDDYYRHRLLQGEVHDERAYLLGGTAGHAGLFSTTTDLSRFAAMMVSEGRVGDRVFLKPETIAKFTRRADPNSNHTRALGWDTRSQTGYSSAGSHFGPLSFGHTGFTGTSLWIDPDSKLFAILLTNRVYPSRDNSKYRSVRPAVADLAFRALRFNEPDDE